MTNNIFRDITTRVHRNVWVDGIIELSAGLCLIGMGVIGHSAKAFNPRNDGVMMIIFLSVLGCWWLLLNSLKTMLTYPRLGYMKVGQRPLFPERILVVLVYGVIVLWVFNSKLVDFPPLVGPLSILITAHAVAAGLFGRSPRFLVHPTALVLFLYLRLGAVVFLCALGTVWLISGLMVFTNFLRQYPIVKEDDINA